MKRVSVACATALGVLLLVGACGGGGSSAAGGSHPTTAIDARDGRFIIETAATGEYRSVALGAGVDTNLSFTGLFRAWFTRFEYRPPAGWLCGRGAEPHRLVVSREDGSGLHAIASFAFSSNGVVVYPSCSSPSWSPDGEWIVCQVSTRTLMLCKTDGSEMRVLRRRLQVGAFSSAAWGPDGRVYFTQKDDSGQVDIYSIAPLWPGTPSRLTNSPAEEAMISFSRDGQWMAWCSREDENDDWDIYIMRRGGVPATDAMKIADTDADETWPRWSPDGRMIAFLRDFDVYIYDLPSFFESRLTDTSAREESCDWSADGRHVLFCRGRDLYRIPRDGSPGDEELVRASWGSEIASWSAGLFRYRVLIGPTGSDWDGGNPPFGPRRPGLVVVTSDEGFVSAVSFQTRTTDRLILTDRTPPQSSKVVVCEAKAGRVYKVLEDNGPNSPKTVWNLQRGSSVPGAVLVTFSAQTGKVRSVTAIWDRVGSAAAFPRVSIEGGRLVIRGDALSVFDDRGRLVSGPDPVAAAVFDAQTGLPIDTPG